MTFPRALASAWLIRSLVTVAVVLVVVLLLSLSSYDFQFDRLWSYRGQFLLGLGRTLLAAGSAYLVGLLLGPFLALARLSRRLVVKHLADMYVEFFRNIPVLVLLYLAWFGVSPILGVDNRFLVGVATLGLFAGAYMCEIFRAGIESIERGQIEAARSLGLGRRQTFQHVVLPQAFKRMIPPLTGELIAITKESALLFVIGYVELLTVAKQAGADTYRIFEGALVAAAGYFAVIFPMSILARRLERRLGKGPTAEHLL